MSIAQEKSSFELIFAPIIQATDRNSAKLAVERVFDQDYSFLRPYYSPAWSEVNRLYREDLVNRQWLKNEINAFVNENDRGFIFIEGEEGTGKTIFLAQLAHDWSSIHHFFSLPQGSKGFQLARHNLGAQIIREWGLEDWITPNRFQEMASSKNFLNELITEASIKNKNSSINKKITIIVDGLEDIGVVFDQNLLGIPNELPENVYFVLSQTPNMRSFNTQTISKKFFLGQGNSNHFQDLVSYCQKYLEDPSFEHLQKHLDMEQLLPVLVEKSQGNWLLLKLNLQRLKNANNPEITIDEIKGHFPESVFTAYLQTFLSIKDEDHAEWYHYILPVLGVLSAYPEPISQNQIILNARLPADSFISKHLFEKLLDPFLFIDLEERCQLNHATLKTFLSGRVNSNIEQSPLEEAFTQELKENNKLYHLRFSDEILALWGKIDDGLPGLRNLKQPTSQDHYGLGYLPSHLEGAGSIDDLKKLIKIDWQSEKNEKPQTSLIIRSKKREAIALKVRTAKSSNGWYVIKSTYEEKDSFLDDVQRAWRNSFGIEEHIYYALVTSSVISSQIVDHQPTSINDQDEQDQFVSKLAVSLAYLGDPNSALATIELISNSKWKSQTFAEMVPHLPSLSIPSVLRSCQLIVDAREKDLIIENCALRLTELSKPTQALEIASQLSSASLQNHLLAQLAKNLFETNQIDMALEAIHHITNEKDQTDLLIELASGMDRDALQTSLLLIRGFHDQSKKATAVCGLAPYLPNPLQRDCLQWLDQLNEFNRSKVLASLIPHMRETLLKDVLSAARDINDETLRAPVLVELTIRTAATGDPTKALQLMQAIWSENYKAAAMGGCAQYLTEEQRYELYGIIQTFKNTNSQGRAFENLIPFLYEPLLTDILEKAYLIEQEDFQFTILKAISKRYLALGETTRSTDIVRKCTSLQLQARLLVALAPFWPETLRSEILTLTLTLENPELLADALIGLLPYLGHTALLDTLYFILQLPEQSWVGDNQRTQLLILMSSQLAQCGDIDKSFTILREFSDDENISKGLLSIFPHLPEEYQAAGLAIVQSIQDPAKKIQLLASLLPMLFESQVETVWVYIDNVDNERTRFLLLTGLSHCITPQHFPEYVERVCKLQEKTLRAQGFSELIPIWLQLPVSQSLVLWKDQIQALSRRLRPDLFLDLKYLAPVISDLGGISAINTTIKLVEDVTQWWD